MTKILLAFTMIIFILFIVLFLSKKYKLNKNQMIIFWILVLFWSSICIIRAYRKLYAIDSLEFGGLGLSLIMGATITSAYGLISFILRLPLFIASDIFNKRKIFIQMAMIFMVITSFTVYFKPTYNTLYYSSFAMGIGASMLAIFNVLFSETFSSENAAVSASILAVAPLLAEFIAAPIQYLGTHEVLKNYSLLWLASGIIAMLTLILTLFMKELHFNTKQFSKEKVIHIISNKKFITICFISVVVSFVKFSTSGPNLVSYAKISLNMSPIMVAYLDTMFATPQLIASILVGTYFTKKIGIEKTLILSLFSLLNFYIIILFTNNPNIIFVSNIFNGFGYGGTYIALISIALQYFDKEYRNISMGIFQAFFSFGIFFGDRIYVFIAKSIPYGILGFDSSKSIFLIVSSITVLSIILGSVNLLSKGVIKK
ncbi:MFS transporter [Caviibacter abscessus]|uniref:MFS transporter n=1 Tax=Caviibacter abscessus TaxID=1766719 RepID=UPI000AC90727|nr:MFS transporter [Caviibacter abscessus]